MGEEKNYLKFFKTLKYSQKFLNYVFQLHQAGDQKML